MTRTSNSIESFERTCELFSERIKDLEDTVLAFQAKGGSLESRASELIRSLRRMELSPMLSDVGLYKRFFSQQDYGLAGEVLERLRVSSYTINLALANAYLALSPEAKAAVPDRAFFDLVVTNKPSYLAHLREIVLPNE